MPVVLRSSAAPVPAENSPPADAPLTRPRIPRQASLFLEEAEPASPRVIPFESITGAPRKVSPRPRPQMGRRSPSKSVPDRQASLDFLPPPPPPPKVSAVGAAVYCNAPVAPRILRVAAALLDALIVTIGLCVVLTILQAKAGEVPLTRPALLAYAGVYAGLLALFKLMGNVLAERTPGTEWMRLRVLHFDGRTADLRLRLLRLAASCLSLLPAGAGLLWALADEERLTWHDHISKTFVTTR